MSSMALASLTATYTDSEGEDEDQDRSVEDNIASGNTTPDKTPVTSATNSPVPVKVTSKVSNLVSYFDDTVVSDEENEGDSNSKSHEVIILTETESIDQGTCNVEPIEEDGLLLPPEPPGHCSSELQEKIMKLYEKMQSSDIDMNAVIQQRKDFRNPSIYEKLIQFCGINELGTNYPPAVYDSSKWGKESYYEELSKVQKSEMEKREKDRKSKVEVMSGTKRQEEDAKKRKSKWDQPGGNSVASIKPAGLIQPSLTSSATGTKATVISAFGSLPKKPRP